MKQLTDIFNESILDDDFVGQIKDNSKIDSVWQELSKDWGNDSSTLFAASFSNFLSADNIAFDKKDRIVFKNLPDKFKIILDYELAGIPDCVRKYGWGDLKLSEFAGAPTITVRNSGCSCKLSQLGFRGKTDGALIIEGGTYELDEIPDFTVVKFVGCSFKNISKMPKKKPARVTLQFDSDSQANIFDMWCLEVLKKTPGYMFGGIKEVK